MTVVMDKRAQGCDCCDMHANPVAVQSVKSVDIFQKANENINAQAGDVTDPRCKDLSDSKNDIIHSGNGISGLQLQGAGVETAPPGPSARAPEGGAFGP